jgi:hypothetical protein
LHLHSLVISIDTVSGTYLPNAQLTSARINLLNTLLGMGGSQVDAITESSFTRAGFSSRSRSLMRFNAGPQAALKGPDATSRIPPVVSISTFKPGIVRTLIFSM